MIYKEKFCPNNIFTKKAVRFFEGIDYLKPDKGLEEGKVEPLPAVSGQGTKGLVRIKDPSPCNC